LPEVVRKKTMPLSRASAVGVAPNVQKTRQKEQAARPVAGSDARTLIITAREALYRVELANPGLY
jgi:hypothetical protein